MPFATLEALRALKDPGPLEEIYTISGTDYEIRIVGIVSRFDILEKIYKECAKLQKMPAIIMEDGSQQKMTQADIEIACFLAACVVEPQLPSLEWARFLHRNGSKALELRHRCLVCCRIIADGEAGIPSGAEAAKAELLDTGDAAESVSGGPMNPFDLSSSSSSLTSSSDSPGSSPAPGGAAKKPGTSRSRVRTSKGTSTSS